MKAFSWIKSITLTIVAVGAVATLSCSRKPENPAWFQSTSTGKSLNKTILIYQAARTDDIFTLYRMKDEYRRRGGKSPVVEHALGKKWKELLGKNPPLGEICPEADLIAFNYQKIGAEKYQVDYLFKVNQQFERDYWIALYGLVDKSNLNLLSDSRRKARKKGEAWNFPPDPPTSSWPAGEYILISRTIPAQPIPYKMHTILYDPGKKSGLHGQSVKLGWRVDLGE